MLQLPFHLFRDETNLDLKLFVIASSMYCSNVFHFNELDYITRNASVAS